MGRTKIALVGYLAIVTIAVFAYDPALAAGIRVVPSTQRALPGDNFYVDVVAEGIPAEGLEGVQFRLNVAVPGGTVTGVADLGQTGANQVAVSSPLLVSQPTPTRSGIGDFFWIGRGNNGILVMDNEPLVNGSALYTFAHTNGSTRPAGSGSVARFMIRVAPGVNTKQININLTDVILLDGGPVYPLDYNTGATVQIGCFTRMPELIGLSLAEAVNRLAQAQLVLGSRYEIDNPGGTRPPNVVLEQSAPAGSELLCEATVNLAVDVPPLEVTQAAACDKPGDDTGVVVVAWGTSLSGDVAGYRVYRGANLLKDVGNPAATGTEAGGLPNGVTSQLKVTAYDIFGNESQGVTIAATPLDDVAPVAIIAGVTEGAYYRSDVTPQVSVSDTNLAETTITLNGNPYAPAPITTDGAYTLSVTGADSSGNRTTKSGRFTVDKTPPSITVINVANNAFYNSALTPAISVTDVNLKGSSVTLNGQPYVPGTPVNAGGSYDLVVSAEDLAGNSASLAVAFVIDTVPPTLGVSTLSAGSYTNNETLNVAGTVRDDAALRDLQINGFSVPVGTDGSFSYALVLQSGLNTLTVTATDNAGNQTTDSRTVVLDQTAPALVITTPADNAKTDTALLTVAGNVDENSTVLVKLDNNGQSASMNGNSYTATVNLAPGSNTIEITATDLAGNQSSQKRTVLYDDQKPSVAITDPSQDIRTNKSSLIVKGTASDPLTSVIVTITMDNQTYTPPIVNGAFEQAVSFIDEKNYSIVATATNEVESATSVQRNVIYDRTPPALTINPVTSPTSQSSQEISGIREIDVPVAVTCATATVGVLSYPTATTWTVGISNLQFGNNTIFVTATDTADNTGAPVSAAILVSTNSSVSAVGPAKLWIGLKNSDDQGTQFDLRDELYLNGVRISEGVTLCITGVTRNPSLAKEIAVPFNPVSNGSYASGDVLSLKVLTRIGTTATGQKCPGPGGSHNNAVGLRLYYDAPDRPSSFSAAIAPDLMKEYYLHATNGSPVADAVAPMGTLKYLDSSGINYSNGNQWKEIGTWTKVLQ